MFTRFFVPVKTVRTVPLTKVKLVLNGCAAQNFPVGRREKVAGFLFFS